MLFRASISACLLSLVLGGATLALKGEDFANLKLNVLTGPISLPSLGGPADSVLVIRGKVDMGSTSYYSVVPSGLLQMVMIDGADLEGAALAMGFYKAEAVPQFKSSEAAGWTLYLYAQTGGFPDRWQLFKAMKNATVMSAGSVDVIWKQGDSKEKLLVAPAMGVKITKVIGPVQPK